MGEEDQYSWEGAILPVTAIIMGFVGQPYGDTSKTTQVDVTTTHTMHCTIIFLKITPFVQ